MSHVKFLECAACAKRHEARKLHNLCECGGPLLARYDTDAIRAAWPRDAVVDGPDTMWRYAPILPVEDPAHIVSLGEGMTPLIHTKRLGETTWQRTMLWVKDEGLNPTGSFKARGLSCAVSMCVELGVKKVAIPSAGNAASALAAYAAAAGIEAHIFMPRDVPQANYIECKAFGAHVTLVDGLISDCGKMVAARKAAEGWFDISTLKEPYRIEGKKTMGYEVAEQFDWELPDAIFLSHRRRSGHDRHVEGVRRDGSAGLDRRAASEDDCGAGGRLRADRAGFRRRKGAQPVSGMTRARWRAGCACPSRWAIFWCSMRCGRAAARRSR